MYIPNTTWTWSFMLVAVFQAAINLALQCYVFGRFQASLLPDARNSDVSYTIPTYLALFIFGFLYQLILVWDALRLKNTIQVIGLCIYNLGMVIYAAVEISQVDEAIEILDNQGNIQPGLRGALKPFLIAAPCVLALGTVLLALVAWKLYDEFAWSIYKHISADLRLKRRFLTYQIYIALLKFDFFFFLGFTVQFLVVVRKGTTPAEFGLTIAAIPITIALLFLAAWFTQRESTVGQVTVIAVYFAAMAYFFFKLVRMYNSPKAQYYESARHSLTTFAVLTLLLLIVTIVVAIMCMRNFNKGLKPHVRSRRSMHGRDSLEAGKYTSYEGYHAEPHPMGAVGGPSRMTID
ncbi:uncharacterized protein K489DRAFT_408154 [Dissoconium aciculare CBS 342.82]|uniref:Uncharacterized protein n=1 Tax=Dissoconium aciculare CBS 342.82 TaxID=1314786 RepID=A0A6J3MBX1_9PEZI|nr:uncharacterized protein K489DRAFT_408154 [Dissoconium aciculare CBS 342.82]KAF1825505.1 hypothetical protein K489DRAFT_408154 [Dissoconium aciculare CBS 342.82]